MNKELFKAQQWVLDSAAPEEYLNLVDMYIEMYNRSPSNFRMPQEHELLVPVIRAFYKNLGAFVEFVRKVRDEASPDKYEKLHEIYRRFNSRFVQQERRRRLAAGIAYIESELNMKFTFGQKADVETWLGLIWSKRRADMLNEARNAGKRLRLTTEERDEICEAHGKSIDEDIKNNLIPIPPQIVYGKLASIDSYKPRM